MELAIILTVDETEKVSEGDEDFIAEVESLKRAHKVTQVLGRDDALDSLYTLIF